MTILLKGLQDVCWGGNASVTTDNIRAIVSDCSMGIVQYLATHAYYLSHVSDTHISSAFLLNILRDKLVAAPQHGGGCNMWNGFVFPLYSHWLNSQKSLNKLMIEECRHHKQHNDGGENQHGGSGDLAFGKVFGVLLSVVGTLSACQGAYDLLLMACTGIICTPCRIAVMEVVQRDRCSKELTSEQRQVVISIEILTYVADYLGGVQNIFSTHEDLV